MLVNIEQSSLTIHRLQEWKHNQSSKSFYHKTNLTKQNFKLISAIIIEIVQ